MVTRRKEDNMRYPRRNPYLIFKRTGRDEFMVKDYLSNETVRVSSNTATFLENLDGRHDPYRLLSGYSRECVNRLIKNLEQRDLLAPKKVLMKLGFGSCVFPLVYCYPNKALRLMGRLWNALLMLMFLPMLGVGIYLQKYGTTQIYMQSKSELYLAMVVGTFFGILLHELSHGCAGLAYNARLFEMGIGSQLFIPLGYILMDDSSVKSRIKRIQIRAAGIEMNLLLYGVFHGLAALGLFNPFVMEVSGTINLSLAIVNSLPLNGLDGMKILSIISGKEDVLGYAKKLIRQRKWLLVKPFRNVGSVAAVTASYGLVGFQIVFPMLLIYEAISLVRLILL